MGISIDTISKSRVIFLAYLAMLTGLFVSRALLSMGMMLFLLTTLLHANIGAQLQNFLRRPFLVGMSLLFAVTLLSGLWSGDKSEWAEIVRIKLPLLLFPIAFAGDWRLSPTWWQRLAAAFLLATLLAVGWSLWQYGQQAAVIHEGYLRAKIIPTPMENDHIRFSWLVAAAAAVAFVLALESRRKSHRVMMVFLLVLFSVYLHMLSVRTGLFSLYLFFLVAGTWLLREKRRWKTAALAAALLVALPLAAYLFFPTFQNRVRYNLHDISMLKEGYQPGSNDGNRLRSIHAGWDILKEHPFGVGAGDVIHETRRWYDKHIPGMQAADRLYPHSEWMIYGAAAGWPGIIIFSLAMLLPLLERTRCRYFWIALNGMAAFSFLFDIGLEVQFGVFIYACTVLWWWKWLQQPPSAPPLS